MHEKRLYYLLISTCRLPNTLTVNYDAIELMISGLRQQIILRVGIGMHPKRGTLYHLPHPSPLESYKEKKRKVKQVFLGLDLC